MRSDAEKRKEQEDISLQYQKTVMENGKQTKRGKAHGVVVTPVEVVDFQIRSILHGVAEMGVDPDQVKEWLDPFGGTGMYTARLLQIVDLPPDRKWVLAHDCIVIEIDPHAATVCANNLAAVLYEETGRAGNIRVICTDTFKLNPDADLWDPHLPVVYPNLPFVPPKMEVRNEWA